MDAPLFEPITVNQALDLIRQYQQPPTDNLICFGGMIDGKLKMVAAFAPFQNIWELISLCKSDTQVQLSSLVAYCCKAMRKKNVLVTFCHKRGTLFQGSSWNYHGKNRFFLGKELTQEHHIYWKSLNHHGNRIAKELKLENNPYPKA